MFTIKTGKNGQTLTIRLEGEATIVHAKEIHAAFVAAAGEAQIEIDMGGITQIDLSFLQLVQALRHETLIRGTALAFSRTLPPALQTIAQRMGCCADHWGIHLSRTDAESAAA